MQLQLAIIMADVNLYWSRLLYPRDRKLHHAAYFKKQEQEWEKYFFLKNEKHHSWNSHTRNTENKTKNINDLLNVLNCELKCVCNNTN